MDCSHIHSVLLAYLHTFDKAGSNSVRLVTLILYILETNSFMSAFSNYGK